MSVAAAIAALLLAGAPVAQASPAPTAVSEPARTGQDVLSARLPPYPSAPAPTRVGDTMTASGVPMNIQSFTTPDDPRKVLEFYKAAMEKLGLPLLGDGDLLVHFPYPSITAFDDAHGVDLSVIAMRDTEQKLTVVFLALADMKTLHQNVVDAVADRFGGLPPYPEARAPRSMTSSDGERKQVTVTFNTPDVPEKVRAYYIGELGKQGFHPAPSGDLPNELSLVSSDAAWHLVVSRDEKSDTLVFATWSRQVLEEGPP